MKEIMHVRTLLQILFLAMVINVSGQEYYRNWTVVNTTKKERIALIIANNTYESGGNLSSPIPVARKLETKLKSEGFDVLVGRDLNRNQMLEVVNDFSGKFTSYEFSMIFFLGHGFQIDGENYLIPIDANPMTKDDVEVQAINVDYLMRKIDNPEIPKVVVLDACRDNPFAANWNSSDRSGGRRGFGTVSAPRNAEIFFTTAEGSRVRDDNPYLNYFMEELKSGSCISDIKRAISRRIYEYNQDQIPASYGQLFDEVCFGTKVKPDPTPTPTPTPNPDPRPDPKPNPNIDEDLKSKIDRKSNLILSIMTQINAKNDVQKKIDFNDIARGTFQFTYVKGGKTTNSCSVRITEIDNINIWLAWLL